MTNALKNSVLFIIVSCATFAALTMALTPRVGAQEQQEEQQPVTVQEENTEQEQQNQTIEGSYDFVAQSGDSYSQMARKATQIYGIESQTELSEAQIMFVETNLTQKARSPLLDLGEAVSIQKADVNEWVELAKSLTDDEKAAWQYYADMADFNTNSVGE